MLSEKAKALDVTLAIKDDEHGGKSNIVVVDEGAAPDAEGVADFFAALGCSDPTAAAIKSAQEGGDDDKVTSTAGGMVKLYHASDESGSLTTAEVTDRPLPRDALKTEDIFILVSGGVVYAWVGKKASPGERKGAMATAVTFLEANGLPANTPVKIVKEGTEPPLFKQAFHQWNKPSAPAPGAAAVKKPERKRAEVDAAAMARGGGAEAERVVDDGSGELKIWRIENFKMEPVAPLSYGQFFAGDSYVLQYTYDGGKQHVIYFWQGRDSTADEKGASALLAKELDNSLGGEATQVRVVMGKEPGHFRQLFKGRMIVHTGGKAGAFKNRAEQDSYDDDGVGLYHVRGTTDLDTRAVQIEDDAGCLNSGDCFILSIAPTVTKGVGRVIVWEGSGASDDERRCAKTIAELLAPKVDLVVADVEVVEEGEEPDAFWSHIGGKKEYAKFSEEDAPPQDPRLFQICDAAAGGSGVACEEIFNFTQDDLADEDVMLLDVVSEVFLWIGGEANENEKREAQTLAQKYIAACAETDGRDVDTPVTSVAPGAEPPMFTCHFIGWDASNSGKQFVDPYEAKLKEARGSNAASFEVPKLKKTPVKLPKPADAAPTGVFEPPKLNRVSVNGATNGGGESEVAMVKQSAAAAADEKVNGPCAASGAAVEVTAPAGSKVGRCGNVKTSRPGTLKPISKGTLKPSFKIL